MLPGAASLNESGRHCRDPGFSRLRPAACFDSRRPGQSGQPEIRAMAPREVKTAWVFADHGRAPERWAATRPPPGPSASVAPKVSGASEPARSTGTIAGRSKPSANGFRRRFSSALLRRRMPALSSRFLDMLVPDPCQAATRPSFLEERTLWGCLTVMTKTLA